MRRFDWRKTRQHAGIADDRAAPVREDTAARSPAYLKIVA
jgi:hypothetical protein